VVGTADADTELGRVLDSCGVRVQPGDAPALAKALSELSKNSDQCSKLGHAGRCYAERMLDKNNILLNFQSEVDSLVNRRCPA
jgi:colanic acid biosynthesis glycosyl transferase WcaI